MEKTLQEKRREWLDSHLAIYLEDPSKRSLDENGDCVYRGLNGCKCIIGQDIPDESYSDKIESASVNSDYVIAILPIITRELGQLFLSNCQYLHDFHEFWDNRGLNSYGKKHYDDIIKEFCQ